MNEQLSILRPYLRGLPIIVLAMVAGFLFAKKYLSYTTPMYESTTKIKLADLNQGVTGNNLFKDLDVFASTNKIAMEIEVLKSQVLLEKMLMDLDFEEELSRVGRLTTKELFKEKPFFHQLHILDDSFYNKDWTIKVQDTLNYTVSLPGLETEFTGTFGDTLQLGNAATLLLEKNTSLMAIKANLEMKGEYKLVRYSPSRLIEKVAANLDVVSVDKDVAILRIIYKSNVPEKAAILTDALAQTYISDYIEEKFKTADVTSDFLDQQIAKVYQDLSRAEMRIEGYRVDNNIINIRQETETDLRKISQLKIQQTNVQMSLEAIQELDDYISSGKDDFLKLAPNFEAFTDLLSTEMIKKIKQLQLEKADLLLIYKADHELVVNVDKKIKYYTDYFIESISNTRKNLETKHAKLNTNIEEAEKVFIGLPERERILSILDREFQIHQQSYIFLNEKRIEAEIAKAAKHAFHRVIHKASIPQKPVSPNRPIIIIVSTLLGMIGAIIFIFLVNASKARVNDLNSVEKNTDIPVLFGAPHFKSDQQAQSFFKNEVFKLDMKGMLPAHSSVAFSAFGTNHGSRFHLRQLLNVFIQEQRNFILLTFDEAYFNTLPAGRALLLSQEELTSFTFARLKEWYNGLCSRYDLVLVDNFNLPDNTESVVFMGLADQNICVVDTRKTHLKRIEELNVIRAKNEITNLYLALNNHKYSPSLLREGWWMIRNVRKLITRQ
ncbi:exopolysaccharide transport family protein [Neolewinella agarilytica]|uniref:G-rich domain on putative tyrosine kinase n=1 Tax=Neolewinella agarilytica TaxID=478744 RepID=A0A1H9MJQ2_9BACT|nr:GNVR domain-containing protein [Neolewinella agarilytica]SER23697.1 G-rich domain on putative tyrosine kinase [Neolewinella agarilytica]